MQALNITEQGKLKHWRIDEHYAASKNRYDDIGKTLVRGFRVMLQNSVGQGTVVNGMANVTEDEVVDLLKTWLTTDQIWNAFLARKSHLLFSEYPILTDIMARYITWSSYNFIVS